MARFIQIPRRPRSTTLPIVALWFAFYASFTLFRPALLDDADSVHAEVAREMLLRHDYVTLYANGIRYLEKAPLLYWSMAASMRAMQALGHPSARALAVAVRIPMALSVLALAFAVEIFARRIFGSVRAGLYAALILLSCPSIFLFSRILLPDVMLCVWITLALLCFWQTEEAGAEQQSIAPSPVRAPFIAQPHRAMSGIEPQASRLLCYGFAACCALGVLTKGFIGVVFPVAITAIYLLLTRGLRGAIHRTLRLHPFSSFAVFFAIAAPWHILAAWANPTRGRPGDLTWLHGHWFVPIPTPGNVHGWAWFYFVNEQVLRYLNLRVPRDYDTVPLWLFWGLCFVWLMPWSAFVLNAIAWRHPLSHVLLNSQERRAKARMLYRKVGLPNDLHGPLLLLIWTALPLLFFSFSTRQEYYVLPSLPPLAILIGGWLAQDAVGDWQPVTEKAKRIRRANLRCTAVLVAFGAIFAAASIFFLLHTRAPAPDTDLAALLQQNPGDYALSMGHFLDLNAQALALFRLPLVIAAASLFFGPLASYLLRRRLRPHAATLALSAGAFGFLLAAHLGLQTFAPVLSSQQLAAQIAPQLASRPGKPPALVVIHQEYEYGSTLGFYLQRPNYQFSDGTPIAIDPVHILTEPQYNGVRDYGRSSNLWYGSFFPDAPDIFETQQSLAAKWPGPQRIFLWQDLANQPAGLPAALSPLYVIATSGGKEIVSNQPNP